MNRLRNLIFILLAYGWVVCAIVHFIISKDSAAALVCLAIAWCNKLEAEK